jgi:transposase
MKGERACAEGGKRLSAERVAELTASYDKLVTAGLEAQPPPGSAGAGEEAGARNLLLRLGRRKEEVLRFLDDFSVPFENNQAERDLRMIKLQQKTSGCFRTGGGRAGSTASVLTSRRRGSKAEECSEHLKEYAAERR